MMLSSLFSASTFLISFTILIINVPKITTSNEENLEKLERYLPGADVQLLSTTNERFKNIMQGSGGSEIRWKDPPPPKIIERIDVKDELNKLNISHIYQPNWPTKQRKLGAVSAVSIDKAGNVVIFHRSDRIWNYDAFNDQNYYQKQKLGAITENTVIAFNSKNGKVVYEWGSNLFYMPHGLTVDHEDNVWVTDVALHQVMKFGPKGIGNKPLKKLGTALKPGHSQTEFCKPTSVAVLPNGDFFVADGYCNSRIMKFSKEGVFLLSWGQNSFHGKAYDTSPMNFFAIPHALTLVPEKDLLCVADRENGRIQCFYSNNGTSHSQYHNQVIGDRIYSVAYAPISGGQFYVVNGPIHGGIHEVKGFIIDMNSTNVISKFGPNDSQFQNPHDIAVTRDGKEIYVAEIDPNRIHKFVAKNFVKKVSISSSAAVAATVGAVSVAAVKPTATIVEENNDGIELQTSSSTTMKAPPGSTALLVIVLVLIFGLVTFGMAVLISRRRKRGCFPFGVRNRRHAWDFPSPKTDSGFKLGSLLGNNERKCGFEKLDQNASDEEPDASTNMLASAQFA